MTGYITIALNKISSMAIAAKRANLNGDTEKAQEIIYKMQIKMQVIEEELMRQSKVSA
jgi:hypothetical protein